jgi:preprotein translocase SecE subunit
MEAYREDQGRLARMAAFWSLTLLLLFGCSFMHGMLSESRALGTAINGWRIPIVSIDVSPSFLIAAVVFVGGLLVVRRYLQRPKTADLLIETEAEMKKVTWPTLQEVVNAAIVVVVCVVFIGAFLALADWLLGRVMRYFILGSV